MAQATVEMAEKNRQGVVVSMTEEKPVNKRLENRRENLRRLIQLNGGPKAFAALVGKPQSFISQMCGPTPSRNVSEDTARSFETTLGLQAGELDWPAPGSGAHVPQSPSANGDTRPGLPSVSRDASVIALLISVVRDDRLHLPDLTFGEVAAFAIADAADTGKMPTPDKLRALIALTKPKSA